MFVVTVHLVAVICIQGDAVVALPSCAGSVCRSLVYVECQDASASLCIFGISLFFLTVGFRVFSRRAPRHVSLQRSPPWLVDVVGGRLGQVMCVERTTDGQAELQNSNPGTVREVTPDRKPDG